MPDWSALVRQRLNLTGLSPDEQEETIAELAYHLDDLYQECLTRGMTESEAITGAVHEVSDWQHLSKTIKHAKCKEGSMNNRTQHLWLPGFVSLTGAVLVFATLTRFDVQPHIYYTRHAALILYFPWLAALPFCGAAAAYLCRRAGGERWACLVCGLFPAAVFLMSIGCIVLFARIFGTDGVITPPALAIVVVTWILLPGAALLLGVLPFLRLRNQRTGSGLVS
jgi:hypothetical protein